MLLHHEGDHRKSDIRTVKDWQSACLQCCLSVKSISCDACSSDQSMWYGEHYLGCKPDKRLCYEPDLDAVIVHDGRDYELKATTPFGSLSDSHHYSVCASSLVDLTSLYTSTATHCSFCNRMLWVRLYENIITASLAHMCYPGSLSFQPYLH